jgi:hypothetical protein
MYFITFWRTVIGLTIYFIKERKKESRHAFRVISALEKQFNGSFDDATRKKIAKGHSVYNPLVVDSFCRLHARTTNISERERLIFYFTCSSLLDNFFDRSELTDEQIEKICFETGKYVATTFDERVAIHCHTTLLNYVRDKATYAKVLESEVKAQQASLQQFQQGTPDNVLEDIMKAKGGNAVLLCSYYLDHTANTIEAQCWYQLGVITQLSNDLYDIHKDINDGISTLATRCADAREMETYVHEQIMQLKELIRELPYNHTLKQRFAIAMTGLSVLGMIAVDRLKQLQGKSDRLPDFKSVKRKQLITDMEKPANMIRWFKYLYRYGRLN